jgi:hypothetical protein
VDVVHCQLAPDDQLLEIGRPGQISPVAIALKVQAAKTGGPEDRAAYLEELIVRRS